MANSKEWLSAFNYDMRQSNYKYELYKEYTPETDKKSLFKRDKLQIFHNIGKLYQKFPYNSNICVIDPHDIIEEGDDGLNYTYEFKILRKLNINEIVDRVIIDDKNGYLCYQFSHYAMNREHVQKLQNVIVQKDETGELCYRLANDLKVYTDLDILQSAVIEKDIDGFWCEKFRDDIRDNLPGRYVEALNEAIREKKQKKEMEIMEEKIDFMMNNDDVDLGLLFSHKQFLDQFDNCLNNIAEIFSNHYEPDIENLKDELSDDWELLIKLTKYLKKYLERYM